jgi:hypothetical protein
LGGIGEGLHFQSFNVETDGFHDANAFVAEDHIVWFIVLVCAADAGVCNFDIDFISGECGAVGGAFDDVAGGRTLVDFELVGSHVFLDFRIDFEDG